MKISFLAIVFAFLGSCGVYATPELRKHIAFDTYEDVGSLSESCYDYVVLTYQKTDSEPSRTHKLCAAGGNPKFVDGRHDRFIFLDVVGGNAAGWGLYRFQESTDKVVRYDFNAREIFFEDKYKEKDGV